MNKQSSKNILSTYRLQLHKEFRFQEVRALLEYFSQLGLSHLYLSPILESLPGSIHGYDGINPEQVSAERGGEAEFAKMMRDLRKTALSGVVLDLVPNHLACHSANPFWRDVLEKGKKSSAWKRFDLKMSDPAKEPILLPILEKSLSLSCKEGTVRVRHTQGRWQLHIHDLCYPLNSRAQNFLKRKGLRGGSSLSLKITQQVLEMQYYKLVDWKTGGRQVNYRRFFDVNDLIGLRMEDRAVFAWFHRKTFALIKKHPGIHGLRIDHVDGLTFPEEYLQRLQRVVPHIWVEKILAEHEDLPQNWPVRGTTGYEFANAAGRLFLYLPGLISLRAYYIKNIHPRWERFRNCVYDSKCEILRSYFTSELHYVSGLFYRQLSGSLKKNFSRQDLEDVVVAVTASLAVYRTYATKNKSSKDPWLRDAFKEVEGRHSGNREALRWLQKTLSAARGTKKSLLAVKTWEQLSGPVMAKGLEDTALYRYAPVVSLNNVGGEPDWMGEASIEFHSAQRRKRRQYPLSFNATSTHDSKRSEDVSSRLHVLTELSEDWLKLLEATSRVKTLPAAIPPATRSFLLQTILGAWPLGGRLDKDFRNRMKAYAVKAAREAKTETSWAQVNADYEKHLEAFVETLLSPQTTQEKALTAGLRDLAGQLSYFGAFNSLSLLCLKILSPGVADFYQGCEMWDFSLVDPDNRRPVDYSRRVDLLKTLQKEFKRDAPALLARLTEQWQDGAIKMFLTWRLLELRRSFPELLLQGDYIPVLIKGRDGAPLVSFMRKKDQQWLWILIPRYVATAESMASASGPLRLQKILNQDLRWSVLQEAPRFWDNIFSGTTVDRRSLNLEKLFAGFPVAVLQAHAVD